MEGVREGRDEDRREGGREWRESRKDGGKELSKE